LSPAQPSCFHCSSEIAWRACAGSAVPCLYLQQQKRDCSCCCCWPYL
jgi:hypothetical protein